MSLFQRAASLAAMTLGIAIMVGASSPGFAFETTGTGNAPVPISVPFPVQIPEFGAETPAPVATDAAQADATGIDTANDQADAYPTLAAAVAAQDAGPDMGRDLTCLAGAIYFEAKGEPLSGQLAVAEVIINRAKSGRFASSICSVVTQRGQFSFVRGGRIPAIGDNAHYRTAVAVAQVAMDDEWDSPAANALYFHARRVSPGWRMQKIASIGNHIFYR